MSTSAPPPAPRRPAVEDVRALGVMYALINYLAPLMRFSAICTFLFGSSAGYRQLLGLPMAAIAVGVVRPALFKLSGRIATATAAAETDGGDPESSSRFHQLRLVWSQGLRCALFVVLYAIACSVFDPRPFGLQELSPSPANASDGHAGDGDASDSAGELAGRSAGLGAAIGLAWSLLWELVSRFAPREKLTVADGTHDLSSASEDEILLGMPPPLRIASLGFRLLSIALETIADVMLVFVFAPSSLDALASPSATRVDPALPALLAASLLYGSQHLRFRGEWLLCSVYGLGLGLLTHARGGRLLPALVGALVFAVIRHARRTGSDVRKFRAQ